MVRVRKGEMMIGIGLIIDLTKLFGLFHPDASSSEMWEVRMVMLDQGNPMMTKKSLTMMGVRDKNNC